MSRKQIFALFICNLVPSTIGVAVIGLLPIYTISLGASETITGILIGLAFGTLAIGTLISGWLSDRFQQRKLSLVLAGAVGVPVTFLMGQVSDITMLTVLTMVIWFLAGITVTTISILIGLYAEPQVRGRTFGIMGATVGLGQFLSGMTSGAIVDRWGFPMLFTVLALIWLVQVIFAMFIDDPLKTHIQEDRPETTDSPLPKVIWVLMIAHLFAATTDSSVGLGRPLLMNQLGFDATAITSVFVITGVILLPLPIVMGWLSDRFERTQILMAGYFVMGLGAFTLALSARLWQFWASSIFISPAMACLSVGLALVNDLATPETQAKAISRFSAMPWIAGVIGYSTTGFVVQVLGLRQTYFVVTGLPLLSVLLVYVIMRRRQPYPVQVHKSLGD